MVVWLNDDQRRVNGRSVQCGSHANAHYRRSFLTQNEVESVVSSKSKPLFVAPFSDTTSGSVGFCCNCMPRSSLLCNRNYYQIHGWRNILLLPSSFYSRNYFCDFYYCFVRHHSQEYLDLRCNQIEDLHLGDEAIAKTDISSIRRCMKSVETGFSKAFIRFVGYVFFKLFPVISRGILVDEGRVTAIKDACTQLAKQTSNTNHPVARCPCVFLPLHTSHLDYLILALVAFCFDFPLPYVGAGNNLDIPIVKWAIKLTGGFFIKRGQSRGQNNNLAALHSERSFLNISVSENGHKANTSANASTEDGDAISKAVLRWTLKTLLSSDQSVEFYVEGTRTRSGRPCSPRIGLLSLLIDCLNEDEIPDVCIVPTCLTYERVWELDDLVKEQLGKPKEAESLWSSVKAAFNLLRAYCGLIRVDFGEPFSLREFVERARQFENTNRARMAITPSPIGVAPQITNTAALLAQHVIFDCSRIAPITLTHALAFLLLTKFRKGENVKVIAKSLLILRREILYRSHDVTFFDDDIDGMADALVYAARVLGRGVVECESRKQNGMPQSVLLRPSRELRSILTLHYCAARVMIVFAAEAVIATSFVAATKLTTSKLNGIEVNGRAEPEATADGGDNEIADTEFRVDQNVLLERADVLCRLLSKEFIFVPSCQELNSLLNSALQRLLSSDVLRYRDAPTRPFVNHDVVDPHEDESQYSGSEDGELGHFLDDEDEEEHDEPEVPCRYVPASAPVNDAPRGPTIELNLMHGVAAATRLLELRGYLLPILESQWVLACNLTSFIDDPTLIQRERDFVTLCHGDAIGTYDDGNICHAESASMVTLSNSLKCFELIGFVKRRVLGERNGMHIELGPFASEYMEVNVVEALISLLEYFRVLEQSTYPSRSSSHYVLIEHILNC